MRSRKSILRSPVDDTSPKSTKLLHELVRKKSPEERLIMGCSMFDESKIIVAGSIKRDDPNISERDLRVKIFGRFYRRDFDKKTFQKINRHLKDF